MKFIYQPYSILQFGKISFFYADPVIQSDW